MQRICKQCKKPIYNMMSNLCTTTCLEQYTTRKKELIIDLMRKGHELYSAKEIANSLFNPMENEYI